MTDVLTDIVRRTRERLVAEAADVHALEVVASHVAQRRKQFAFSAALRQPGVNIIAEIKAASPSAGPILDNPDVEQIAIDYRDGGAAAISVVAEPEFFGGSRDWIRRAAGASGLPVIMKDFVVDPAQILAGVAAGASAVLLLASLLEPEQIRGFIRLLDRYGCDALVEAHDEIELERAISAGARLIGVNNRDLRTFNVDLATSERLSARMPSSVIRVAESGIRTAADIERLRRAGFNAFLVGESLLRQNDRAAAVRALAASRE